MAWMYIVAVGISLGLIGLGWGQSDMAVIAAGGLGLVFAGCTAPIALRRGGEDNERSLQAMRDLHQAIEHLAEHQALSDDARRVLNRNRERSLLQKAIEEDIRNQDWDAALVLVQELAESFGYRADAEDFRERIEASRTQSVQEAVREAVQGLDGLVAERRWTDAMAEAARIGRLYPEALGVTELRGRVEAARQQYKAELERRFLNAANEGHAEQAMHLLQELDQYLTEQEAEPLKEVARGVIGQARDNLGVRFKLAVQDRQWTVAADLGERIIEEFPNSRMAEEVRGLIDGIRERAGALR